MNYAFKIFDPQKFLKEFYFIPINLDFFEKSSKRKKIYLSECIEFFQK